MMLSPTEERVIARAVRAQRAYWSLVKQFSDDARRRSALQLRYVEVQAELRGDRKTLVEDPGPIDCWIPLKDAVQRELKRRTPQITIEVAAARETRRLAVGCGYVELALGRFARIRRHLRQIVWRSGLSLHEFASAIGVSSGTIENHLGGRRPSASRAAWYDRLEAITIDDEHILIAVRRAPRTRKRYGWRKPLELEDDE